MIIYRSTAFSLCIITCLSQWFKQLWLLLQLQLIFIMRSSSVICKRCNRCMRCEQRLPLCKHTSACAQGFFWSPLWYQTIEWVSIVTPTQLAAILTLTQSAAIVTPTQAPTKVATIVTSTQSAAIVTPTQLATIVTSTQLATIVTPTQLAAIVAPTQLAAIVAFIQSRYWLTRVKPPGEFPEPDESPLAKDAMPAWVWVVPLKQVSGPPLSP